MKRVIMLGLAAALCAGAPSLTAAQSGAELLQQALKKERVDGDLKSAIALYQRILKDRRSERATVAKALVQLGGAYEKLGQADARAAYERVLREYADQPEQIAIARARLAAFDSRVVAGGRSEPTLRRVWAGPAVDPLGAPTRDGRFLTFVDWETGDLALRDLASGESKRLTNKGPWTSSSAFALFSVPSPDGRSVAYSWYSDAQANELRVMGIDGRDSRVIVASDGIDYVAPMDWSADGKHILALIARKNQPGELALVAVADGSARTVKTFDARSPDKALLSPDGRFVFYDFPTTTESPARDIHVVPSTGGRETTLVGGRSNDRLLALSPDGRAILFASDRSGSNAVWLQPISGGTASGEPRVVHGGDFRGLAMGVTRNGTFFYGSDPSPVDLYSAPFDATTGKVTAAPTRISERRIASTADWSPTGKFIAYVAQSRAGGIDNDRLLVLRSTENGAERILTTAFSQLRRPRWGGDDRTLFITGRHADGKQGIYRLNTETGEAKLVVAGNRESAGVTADGSELVYLQRQGKTASIRAQDLATGKEREVYRPENATTLSDLRVSPDHRWIVALSFGEGAPTRVIAVPMSGGTPRDIYQLKANENAPGIGWSPDGRYVFFAPASEAVPGADQKTTLVRVSLETGRAEPVGVTMDRVSGVHLSPDGRQITFVSGRKEMEIWAMENFLTPPRAESAPKAPKRRAKRD